MKRNRGFTLVELMVVLVIVAVIAGLAIPQLMRSNISANETTAIATLLRLRNAETQFQQMNIVDQDADAVGEYAVFQELAGTGIPRGAAAARMSGEFLPQEMGYVNAQGIMTKGGYNYLIYLPTSAGPAKNESQISLATPVPADGNDQETRWCCFAWPVTRGDTGKRCFVINQSGVVYQTPNDSANQLYTGTTKIPAADAAFIAVAGLPAANNLGGRFPAIGTAEKGADGGTWAPAN